MKIGLKTIGPITICGLSIADFRFADFVGRFCETLPCFIWRVALTPYKRMRQFVKYWLPLLIWLVVIFLGSTSVMSAEHTSRYIVPFLLWLKPGMSPTAIWTILVVVRKCAHVSEYAVLALLLWRALRSVRALQPKTLAVFGAVLGGCTLFAASDEFHQMFVNSRTPSVRDVFLDVAGALVGLLIAVTFARRDKNKFRRTTENRFVDAQL
jgi:VanZ family protein